MITPAIQTEIENIITAIDSALLNIYQAEEKKYQFFNFKSSLQNILSNPHHINWSYKVERWLAVFTDLFKPVKHYHSVLKEINKEKYQLVYETFTTSDSGKFQNDDNIVSYQPAEFESMCANADIGEQGITVVVSKMNTYIGDTLNDTENIKMLAFEKGYEAMFSKYGYNKSGLDFHQMVPTFEQYIDWLKQERGEK